MSACPSVPRFAAFLVAVRSQRARRKEGKKGRKKERKKERKKGAHFGPRKYAGMVLNLLDDSDGASINCARQAPAAGRQTPE